MMELPSHVREALKDIPPFKRVVVGLSGGMDSVVLTHVLKKLGYEVVVAHLNHGLRGEASDGDEAFVIELAKAWDLPYSTSKTVIEKGGNMENNARKIRYAYLESVRQSYSADFIAVGHHFDDQIETILMHEKRGAGLRGKRGMLAKKGLIIRPLLEVPRRDIEAYAKEHLLDYMTDETNEDVNLERNRLRHEVIPTLKEDPEFENNVRKMSAEAGEKIKALEAKAEVWKAEFCHEDSFDRGAFNTLDKELRAEILIELLGQENVYSATVERMLEFIEKGKTGKEMLAKKMIFVIEYDRIRWMKENEEGISEAPVKKVMRWGDYMIKVKNLLLLRVRPWKKGDRFQPSDMKGTKKLQDFFVDLKIPRHKRKDIPIVVDEKNEIVCVGDLRFSETHKDLKGSISVKKVKGEKEAKVKGEKEAKERK